MSPHTVLLCDTGHYSPYYSQPFTTLITWKILQPIVQKSLRERNMWLCVFIFFALEQKTERNRTTAHTSWRRKSHQKMLWNTIAQNAHHIVVYHHLYSPCFQGGGVLTGEAGGAIQGKGKTDAFSTGPNTDGHTEKELTGWFAAKRL